MAMRPGRPLDVEGLYQRFAEGGFAYGPAFQGLRAAWRLGDEVFAAASLPERQQPDAARFGLHPALLDSALHALVFDVLRGPAKGWLPFSWNGVRLHASGASELRLRLTPTGRDAVAVLATDGTGQLVASARSSSSGRSRPISSRPREADTTRSCTVPSGRLSPSAPRLRAATSARSPGPCSVRGHPGGPAPRRSRAGR